MSFQTTYGPDGRLRVAILGCTGSIGTQALDVCRQHADRLQVTALSVNSSTSELVAAAREFSVPAVAVADVAHGDDAVLQELPEGTKLGVGAQAVCELARRDDVDCVLVAIVGAAGLEASHAALTSNKRLALANKESLVVGGDLLMPLAQPGQLIPVDSEHSAIYQCYLGEDPREAHCIWLTCSGGPFFGRTRDELNRVTVADLAVELELSEEVVLEACALLLGWGSIAPWYEEGEKPSPSYYPTKYQTLPRDAAGYTTFDGRRFDREHATTEGDVWELPCGEADFLAQERSHTYLGQGFLKRAFMLLAGILVNILTGFLLLMSIYSIAGVSVPVDSNMIGQVEEGSIAAKAGIEAGDTILSVDGVSCSSWMDVFDAIGAAAGKDDIAIEYKHDGKNLSTSVALKEGERLGVYASTQVVHLDPITSARLSFSYVQQIAEGVMRLLQPQHTMEILDQSSSIVGISVMSSQAAAAGPATFLTFAALISFSLGFMNLLPIPPLDGGKLVIEIIQKVAGRELPLKVQTIVSYVGIVLFALLFVYMLRSDVLRFIL